MGRCLIDPVPLIVKLFRLSAIRAARISRPAKTWVKSQGWSKSLSNYFFLIDVDIKRNRTKQLGTLAASCEQTCDDWVGAISFAIFGWYVYFLAGEVKRWRMINDRPEERRTYIFTSSPNHNKQQLLCLQQATSSHCWRKLNLVSIIIFVPSSWQDHAVVSQI